MTFFYDLNKRLATLASKQDAKQINEEAKAVAPKSKLVESMEVAEAGYSAKAGRAGKDLGKPGKNFSKIAKGAAERYGSKEAGERVAGAVLNKLRHPKESEMDESAFQAAIGKKKYGEKGMKALQQAGREHASAKTMSNIRNKYDKYDESQGMTDEGNAFGNAIRKAKADGIQKGETVRVGSKIYPVKEADVVGLAEKKKAKPDYIDLDGDGNKKETMKKAASDKKRSTGTAFDKEHMDKLRKEKEAETHSRYDVQDTGYSKRYTRKAVDTDVDTDDEVKSDAPKKKGRPKGPAKGPERTTKGAWKHKGERKVKEDGMPITDRGEYDDEAGMAKDSLHTIVRSAKELEQALRSNENLPEWVQEKIGQIKGMMSSVTDYILSTHERGAEQASGKEGISIVPEVAPPGAKAERMVKHIKKSLSKDGHLSDKDKAIAYATTWKAKKAGKVEEESKEEKVDETTVSGSVATAPAETKKSKGGMQFGKGVYEGFNNKVESMITEGMSINISVDEQGKKSISVNATEQDAEALADLLKMAGLGGGQKQEVCSACGSANCGCEEELDENSPDYPTNTETSDDALQYSGGLNGPKSTGQSTTPVLASQLRRQVSMEESVELERSLFKTWKNYKG
jgi:hypothetical protein